MTAKLAAAATPLMEGTDALSNPINGHFDARYYIHLFPIIKGQSDEARHKIFVSATLSYS